MVSKINTITDYLSQFPDYQELEGDVGIVQVVVDKANIAKCDLLANRITIDPSLFEVQRGNLYPLALESYLFEMSNLAQRSNFKVLIDRASQYTPEGFVTKFEELEHQAALRAKKIIRRSFPQSEWSTMPLSYVPDRFTLHLFMQRLSGHTRRIFDRFHSSFSPLASLSEREINLSIEEKKYIEALIDLQSKREDEDSLISSKAESDFSLFKSCILREQELGSSLFQTVAVWMKEIESS